MKQIFLDLQFFLFSVALSFNIPNLKSWNFVTSFSSSEIEVQEEVLFSDDFSSDPNESGKWRIYRYSGDLSKEASWEASTESFHLARSAGSKASAVQRRPVILIPGFGGSILEEDGEEIWPAPGRLVNLNDDAHLDGLILTDQGLIPDGSKISVGKDIVRKVYVQDFYGGAVEILESLGYREGVDLFVFPYDFRQDIKATGLLLEEFIRGKTGGTTGGVDLIGHSQGGLVTKQCILAPGCAEQVNSAAIIGTPYAGTPNIIRLLEYGQRIPDNLIGNLLGVSSNRARIVSQNWPNVYELIPGPNYFALFGQGYYIYDRDFDGDGDIEGRLNYEAMKSFLASRHNSLLVNRGEEFQITDGIDDWSQGTNGVKVFIFAGTGIGTLAEIRESEWRIGPFRYVNIDLHQNYTGDGTVPAISVALQNTNGIDYTGGNVHVRYVNGVKHTDLINNLDLLKDITQIFESVPQRSSTKELTQGEEWQLAVLPPAPQSILSQPVQVNGWQFLFVGDVQVDIFDPNGNRTGPIEGDQIEMEAVGVDYTEVGETVSIFVQGDGDYSLTFMVARPGLVEVKARTIQGGEEIRQLLFASIPFESHSSARMVFEASLVAEELVLELDQDGDGVYERKTLPDSDITGDALKDRVPPETDILLEGQQEGDLFSAPVKVTLSTEDPPGGSGIAKILYSLDKGKTILEYEAPFFLTETSQVYALALDNAGNVEPDAVTVVVKISGTTYLPLAIR